MALTITTLNLLNRYIKGVMERADHHGENVNEIVLTIAGAVIWRATEDVEVKTYKGETANILWLTVGSDRYVESSLVLRRIDGVDTEFIWSLNNNIRIPNLSVIFTAQPRTLDKRLRTRGRKYSRFERDNSREQEVKYYKDAAHFLSRRKYNVMKIENNIASIDENVAKIVKKICQHKSK